MYFIRVVSLSEEDWEVFDTFQIHSGLSVCLYHCVCVKFYVSMSSSYGPIELFLGLLFEPVSVLTNGI
jgi:hypothetical protein